MVFAASEDLKTAYISVGDCMRLTVRGIERRGNLLRLLIVGVESDLMSRRKHVRVAMDKPIPITLRGKAECRAYIRDKSIQGLGVHFPEDIGAELFNKGKLKSGDRVMCAWHPQGVEIKTAATIRWIRKVGDVYRAGLNIDPDQAARKHLQQFLMQHQRGVIARLRSLGLPEWMQS